MRIAALALLAATAGCALPADDMDDVGTTRQAAVVSDFMTSTCSTEVVLGLSRQIADELICLKPDAFVTFEEGNGIVFSGGAVLPYATPEAKADLLAAVAARGGELRINSAFRTVAQQYLLRQWFERGRCDITAAAPPGDSNHESGRAIDVGNYGEWIGALGNNGWDQTVPGDEVHFDHLPSPDLRGFDVLAFQRLWNRNHPDDQIDEDGSYGPMTGERLATAPADGFPIGACSGDAGGDSAYAGTLVSVDAPTVMAPGERAEISISIRNSGEEPWSPGATFLGTTAPFDRASALHDAETWPSASRATTVSAETAPGEVGTFEFVALAPTADETMVSETFGLEQEGVSHFQPAGISIEVLVSSTADACTAGVEGACSTGGSSPPWLALLGLLVLVARRRRTRDATRERPAASAAR